MNAPECGQGLAARPARDGDHRMHARFFLPVLLIPSAFALSGCDPCNSFNQSCDAGQIDLTSCVSGEVRLLGAQAMGGDGAHIMRHRQGVTRALYEADEAAGIDKHASLQVTGRAGEPAVLDVREHPEVQVPAPRQVDWAAGHMVVSFELGKYTAKRATEVMNTFMAQVGHDGVTASHAYCVAQRLCRFFVSDQTGKRLDKQQTRRLVDDLRGASFEGVDVVSTNNIYHAMRLPSDTYYTLQRWHYEFPNLPTAWDITTGDPAMVVATLDTGLNLSHPDIQGKVAQGIDMVSVTEISGDNDGIDLSPNDPGIGTNYHGTHVAGTIAAASNNDLGVSGIMWQGRVQPIRVLGNGTAGQSFDILSGLYWAVGETNFDIDDPTLVIPALNDTPARVVNMSLGAPFEASDFAQWQNTANDILVARANAYNYPVLVVAAGNENQAADNVTPANVAEILTVTAHRYDGAKSAYANWGNLVDIAAPGGQTDIDQNGDGYPDGVLSLQANDYNYEQGTSMASPHVAGIVGLLLSLDPSLTHQEVVQVLRASSMPFPAGTCPEGCGAGYVDAASALVSLGGQIVAGPQLSVDQSVILFPTGTNRMDLRLRNLGDTDAQYELDIIGPQADAFRVASSAGSVPGAGTTVVELSVDRGSLESGFANLEVRGVGQADGQIFYVDLAFNDRIIPPKFSITQVQVGAYSVGADGDYITRADHQVVATLGSGFTYEICGLPEGEYFIFGIGDDNGDGIFDSQTESFGGWPVASLVEPIVMETNTQLTGVDFALSGGFVLDGAGAVGQPCTPDDQCTWTVDAECIPPSAGWPGGYCSRVCDDGYCGGGASCEALDCGGAPCNVCLVTCTGITQCRGNEGFVCDSYNTCSPDGFSP